jgi:transcriptional regulator with XRE-family HTH domain
MNNLTFPHRLKAYIEDNPDMTVAGVAQKAGLDKSTIRQMILKNRSPRMETAERICAALGTTVEEFMTEGQSEEVRNIARLVSQLSVEQRLKLLGYGASLLEQPDQPHQPKVQDE